MSAIAILQLIYPKSLSYIDFWVRVEGFKNFMGLSPEHDEFISVILTLSRSEGPRTCDLEKVGALVSALSSFRNKLRP